MLRIRKVLLWASCLASLYLIDSCTSQMKEDHPDNVFSKYTTHSLNVPTFTGTSFKVIQCKIKSGKLIVKAIDKMDNAHFFVIDMAEKKLENEITSPVKDYFSTSFDTDADNLYVLSALRPDTLFVSSLHSGKTSSIPFHFEKRALPSDIAVSGSQVFLYRDVYGIAALNTKSRNAAIFHNEGATGLVNPLSSTLSLPLDSSLNLLSGHRTGKSVLQFYAIDDRDSVKWKYSIDIGSAEESISLLNFPHSFIVKSNNRLFSLNKEDGRKEWENVSDHDITGIYRWHNKILVYSMINPVGTYPDNDDFKYKIVLSVLDSKQGIQSWTTTFNSVNVPHIGIVNDNILIADNESFTVLSAADGHEIARAVFQKDKKNDFAFEMLTDASTGVYYLKTYDGRILW